MEAMGDAEGDALGQQEASSTMKVKPSLGLRGASRGRAAETDQGKSAAVEVQTLILPEIAVLLQQHHEQLVMYIETLIERIREDGEISKPLSARGSPHSPIRSVVPGRSEHRHDESIPERIPSTFTLDDEDDQQKQKALQWGSIRSSTGTSSISRRGRPSQLNFKDFVSGARFEVFFAAVICLNSLLIGVEVEYTARTMGKETPIAFFVINCVYAFLFLMELVARLCAQGSMFFTSDQWAWNLLDILIVASALLEVAIDGARRSFGSEEPGFGDLQIGNVRIIRMLRITKFIRTLRIPKIIRFMTALRTLIASIIATLKSLLWALVLLVMIIYVFAIVFTQSAVEFMVSEGLHDPLLEKRWGSLPDSMFTLFMSISGGISWNDVIEPLREVSGVLIGLFGLYIFFTYFAVLNVVTGVFCQSAIDTAHRDPDLMVQSLIANKRSYIDKIRELFESIDTDDSGRITFEELDKLMADQMLQAYFEALELDTSDAWTLFKLVDADKRHVIDVEDFIAGCMRLKGTAKGIDMAKMQADNRWMMKRLSKFMRHVESNLELLLGETLAASPGNLTPGAPAP